MYRKNRYPCGERFMQEYLFSVCEMIGGDQRLFPVFGVDFDVFSAFLICMKKSLLSSGAIPQPLSEAVQGGEDQARGESWIFPYGRLKY